MALRVCIGIFLQILSVISVFVSLESRAVTQSMVNKLLEQSPDTLELGMLSLAALFGLLILLLIIFQFRVSSAKKTLAIQSDDLLGKLSLLSEFKVGVLYLDISGNITFANSAAASFLGSKEQKLVNQLLADLFDVETQTSIQEALASNQYVGLKTYFPASRRHLLLGFSKPANMQSGVASVISLSDVTVYQNKIDHQSFELNTVNQVMQQSSLARIRINFEDNSFTADASFSTLLQQPETLSGELASLTALIDKQDTYEWEQQLENSKAEHSMQLSCGFLQAAPLDSESQGSEPKDAIVNTIPLKLTAVSCAKNDKGETTQLDILVQSQVELEAQESQLHSANQHIKTLVATSPNPVYVLDKEAKIVDCNQAFERMFKQKLSALQQKSIIDLQLLPDDIARLHVDGGANFSSVNSSQDKEFELELADKVTHSLKLKIKSFSNNKKMRVGAVGVIQDLTELKQAQNQLEQERKHFTTILDLAPIAVATIDAEDRVLNANISMTDRLGVSERELKKDTFYQLFNDPSNAGKAAKQIHQTGKLRGFVAHLKGKNDELHPSELHVDVLNKDKQEYLCWISDRSKEQFHQDKFDGLLEHSSMPMAVLAEDGFSKLNPAACAFFNVEDEHQLFGSKPFAPELNIDQQACDELERHLTKVKLEGQAKSLQWEHQVAQDLLPCQATYVPMYKGQEFDSILCIWTDFRDLQKADEARREAINLHQAAEKEVAEKHQLLQSSRDQLASKAKNLAETESKLQAAKEDLSEKQDAFSHLQQAHQSVTDSLQQLQQDYNQSRSELTDAQQTNTELSTQLEESTAKVTGLQAQRNQISDALQNSEKKYKAAQQELIESERNAEQLKQEQLSQQVKMQDFVSEIDSLKQSISQKDQQINEVGGQINSLQSQLTSSGNTSEKLRQLLINQRKASEEAEDQRRTLEQSCKIAESELSNKVRHVEHLQNEMQKFEEMSNQQKGDMQQQQAQLKQELESKQQQLQETQKTLDETKQAAEKDKQAKEQQQNQLERLQKELAEMEQHSQKQRQVMQQTEQEWTAQQQKIQQELAAKQQQLQETEQILQQAKEQGEAERKEKEKQLAVFEILQKELHEVEQRNEQQQQEIAKRDQEYALQQQKMQQALKAKQQLLQETEQSLSEAKEQTEAEKKQQQALLETLQHELQDMEERNEQQQQQMARSDEEWQLQQQKIQQELAAKQQQLSQTEQLLSKTKQQTEAEKAEKERQQALFEKLQAELSEMEQRSNQQQQKIAQSDQDWQAQQQALRDEVDAKRQELENTQSNLDEIKRQADAEKVARVQQQQKLERLTVELTDVESRAVKQKEMIEGSDEQWRKHHAEIEQQKRQLQQALENAEVQNNQLQEKLEGNLQQLQQAETQVIETQSGEQKLQDELNQARSEAEELQLRLQQQEDHERKLQQQLEQQQKNLQGSEQSIQSLEAAQAQLKAELQSVQQEYSSSKESLDGQQQDQAQLSAQLQNLEQELLDSKTQLDSKESALQQAQQQLQSNQAKLEQQESALLSAHKEELQQAQVVQVDPSTSAIASLPMPSDPAVWFDLLPYLQNQDSDKPLPIALNELMKELQAGIESTEKAVEEEDVTSILRGARRLTIVANKLNSNALTDVISRLEDDCRQGLIDNISIGWPTVERSLNNTLRVIYSHLHA